MAPPLDLATYLRGITPPTMTYQEFLASRGQGAGNFQASQAQPDYSQMMSKGAESAGKDYLQEALFSAGATPGAEAAGSTVFSGGTTVAGEAIGTAANGGTMMSTGVTVPASAGTPVASGGASAVTGSGIAANAAGMGMLPLAGIAAGTYLGGKSAYDLIRGKKDNSIAGKAGRVTLGIATGGLSELARPFLIRKTTRDVQKDVTKDLQKIDADDPNHQAFVSGMREQYNSAPPDPSKPFAGKYATFDEYEKAGLEAADLTGVEGNLRLGKNYSSLTPQERIDFTQRAINEVGYASKKGGVQSKDDARLAALLQDFIANKGSGQKSTAKPALKITGPTGQDTSGIVLRGNPTAPQPIMIPRSSTKSPGIGLDGKPIQQWRK